MVTVTSITINSPKTKKWWWVNDEWCRYYKAQVYPPFATRNNKKIPRGLDCDNCEGETEKRKRGHTETVFITVFITKSCRLTTWNCTARDTPLSGKSLLNTSHVLEKGRDREGDWGLRDEERKDGREKARVSERACLRVCMGELVSVWLCLRLLLCVYFGVHVWHVHIHTCVRACVRVYVCVCVWATRRFSQFLGGQNS